MYLKTSVRNVYNELNSTQNFDNYAYIGNVTVSFVFILVQTAWYFPMYRYPRCNMIITLNNNGQSIKNNKYDPLWKVYSPGSKCHIVSLWSLNSLSQLSKRYLLIVTKFPFVLFFSNARRRDEAEFYFILIYIASFIVISLPKIHFVVFTSCRLNGFLVARLILYSWVINRN